MMKRLFLLAVTLLWLVGCDDKNHYEEPVAPVQTLLMYFPWSGNADGSDGLLAHFRENISDMEEVVRYGLPSGCRVLVYLVERVERTSIDGSKKRVLEGQLFELKGGGGHVERVVYSQTDAPDMTRAESIAALLNEVQRLAPAPRYAMTIGCHGMGWIPATAATATLSREGAEREYWEYAGAEQTRWFGGQDVAFQTEIPTLAEAIRRAGMKLDYILFDDCYMSSVEVAYELRDVADHLIGSTSEIMAEGFPYTEIGALLLGDVDYEGICESFYQYYMERPSYPCGTVAVTLCRELEALAEVMKRINAASVPISEAALQEVQVLDGYNPCRFYDLGDYVARYCTDEGLKAEFEAQLERAVPAAYRRHTPTFYSMSSGETEINTFSGITTSDPSLSSVVQSAREGTAWWKATH